MPISLILACSFAILILIERLVKSGKSLTKVIVIKLGGSTLGNHDTTLADLVALQKRGMRLVVAHGGASVVTEWLGN